MIPLSFSSRQGLANLGGNSIIENKTVNTPGPQNRRRTQRRSEMVAEGTRASNDLASLSTWKMGLWIERWLNSDTKLANPDQDVLGGRGFYPLWLSPKPEDYDKILANFDLLGIIALHRVLPKDEVVSALTERWPDPMILQATVGPGVSIKSLQGPDQAWGAIESSQSDPEYLVIAGSRDFVNRWRGHLEPMTCSNVQLRRHNQQLAKNFLEWQQTAQLAQAQAQEMAQLAHEWEAQYHEAERQLAVLQAELGQTRTERDEARAELLVYRRRRFGRFGKRGRS